MKKVLLCILLIPLYELAGGGHGARHGHMAKSLEESEELPTEEIEHTKQ